MLPRILKPKKEYDLIRLCQDNDGGYLVEKQSILRSNGLITLGLGYDWSFEKSYSDLTNNQIVCYDHTVNYSGIKKRCRKFIASYLVRIFKPKYFLKRDFFSQLYKNIFLYRDYKKFFSHKATHIEKRIGSGEGGIMLNEIIKINKKSLFFLKVDIEGSEYRILDEIIENQNIFSGIAIEFHDVDLHIELIKKFVENLNMELVHIHPQNPAFVTSEHIPTQLELSFAKNCEAIGPNPKIPHKLDQPANPSFKEIELKFENE